MTEGYIIIHQRQNALGSIESLNFEWQGGMEYYFHRLSINWDVSKIVGNFIYIGPYKLKIISESFERNAFYCVRVDYPFWRLVEINHHASKWLRIIYSRLILTLSVWGLADRNLGSIPSYKDIYVVQWVKRKLRKKK